MNMADAEERLRSLFDVTTKRYPATAAFMHLNQASLDLSRETDLWFDRFVIDYEYVVGSSSSESVMNLATIPITSLTYGTQSFGYLRAAYIKLSNDTYKNIPTWTFEELLNTFNDEEAEEPEAIALLSNRIIIRPVPSVDVDFRFEIKGEPSYSETEETAWMREGPLAVIYRAAEYASVYMMEEERIPIFRNIWENQLATISQDASMNVMNEPRQIQEPG